MTKLNLDVPGRKKLLVIVKYEEDKRTIYISLFKAIYKTLSEKSSRVNPTVQSF